MNLLHVSVSAVPTGSLMMVAWIFAASIGIVIARYFKNVWEDSTWFGQKIWFQVRVMLDSNTVL